MQLPLLLLILLLHPSLVAGGGGRRLQPSWPWSWSRLPVWGCGQGAADFTPADVALLAKYSLIWTQGQRNLGGGKWLQDNKTGYRNYENATASDARKVRAVRQSEPVMGYYGFMGSCNLGCSKNPINVLDLGVAYAAGVGRRLLCACRL